MAQHFGEVRPDQAARQAPPRAPMAPPPGGHRVDQLDRGLNNMHMHPNANGMDRMPTQYHNNGGEQTRTWKASPQGGLQRSQSFSIASSKSDNSRNTSEYRMYEFEKHFDYGSGRKPSWGVAKRSFLSQKKQSDLINRIKKPSQDQKTRRSNAKGFDSEAVRGNKGYKQNQILQLIDDLNYQDPTYEWNYKLIELPERVQDDQTGMMSADRMLVIVKRKERDPRSYIPNPARIFDLYQDVVNAEFYENRRDRPADPRADPRAGGAQHFARPQQPPQIHNHHQGAGPPQHGGPAKAGGQSKPSGPSNHAGQSKPAGPPQRPGPSYRAESHASYKSHAGPPHEAQRVFEIEDDSGSAMNTGKKGGKAGGKGGKAGGKGKKESEDDSDDIHDYGKQEKGGKGGKAQKKGHKNFDDGDDDDDGYAKKDKGGKAGKAGKKDNKDRNDSDDSYGGHEKSEKKGKTKEKSKPKSDFKHSKMVSSSDSESAYSNSFKNSEAGTARSSNTSEFSRPSSLKDPILHKFLASKDKAAEERPAQHASREHTRKNPDEYYADSRGRSAKDDGPPILIQPASSISGRRHSMNYSRRPSFNRSRPNSVEYDEEFSRKYDDITSDGGRPLTVSRRPYINQQQQQYQNPTEVAMSQQVMLETMKCMRTMIEARVQQPPPRYDSRGDGRYEDRIRYDDRRRPRYEDDHRYP